MTTLISTTSPIVKIAAVAVIIFSAVGVGMMTGLLPGAYSDNPIPEVGENCLECGVVESIRIVELKGQATGVGAVTGGVVGAVVGNQIGQGRGKTLAQVAGAAGGAYAGNEIEKNINKSAYIRITVRMNNGDARTFTQKSDPGFRTGENVRFVHGQLVRGWLG